jgi:hypothetical protein
MQVKNISMDKIINDRLNHLKSLYSQESRVKLTKTVSKEKLLELSIRIDELENLKHKI